MLVIVFHLTRFLVSYCKFIAKTGAIGIMSCESNEHTVTSKTESSHIDAARLGSVRLYLDAHTHVKYRAHKCGNHKLLDY